ncbi:MAG: hypothetical protein EP297_13940 [Gammaproteobacteria bacterium]|nr:MAG: hypothetical protein EP297_13940 [Gammaproteobacteria bacterium]
MTILIFFIGLFVASIFAVVTYILLGRPPSHEMSWVDYIFWAIILVSALPLALEDLWLAVKKIKKRLEIMCHDYVVFCH